MFVYLSKLSNGMKILWCYLIWYIYFVSKYFVLDLDLWQRSLGIALLVGFVLNINSFGSFEGIVRAENKYQVFRFFAIPFCVSSFPVIIKDKGFILVLSPLIEENMLALGMCMTFLLFTRISRQFIAQNDFCCPEK